MTKDVLAVGEEGHRLCTVMKGFVCMKLRV